MYVSMYVCISVYLYICISVYIYIYIYVYTVSLGDVADPRFRTSSLSVRKTAVVQLRPIPLLRLWISEGLTEAQS